VPRATGSLLLQQGQQGISVTHYASRAHPLCHAPMARSAWCEPASEAYEAWHCAGAPAAVSHGRCCCQSAHHTGTATLPAPLLALSGVLQQGCSLPGSCGSAGGICPAQEQKIEKLVSRAYASLLLGNRAGMNQRAQLERVWALKLAHMESCLG
jgi:hypothetical protein